MREKEYKNKRIKIFIGIVIFMASAAISMTGCGKSFYKEKEGTALQLHFEGSFAYVIEAYEIMISEQQDMASLKAENLTNSKDCEEKQESLAFDDGICVIENTVYRIPQEKLQKLQQLKSDSEKNYAFYVKDLNSGAVFSYRSTSPMYCASSIKFPYAFYVSKYITENDPQIYEQRITYTESYVPSYTGGSGKIQFEPIGSSFSIGEILDYSIRYSDNVGYKMLVDRFGRKGYGEFVSSLQAESLRIENNRYPYITAEDLGTVYEVYYNELNQNTGADYLWDSLTDCETGVFGVHYFDTIEFIRDILSCTVAEKYGGTPESYNHAGIVMRDQPYVMVILTENGLYHTAPEWHRELITLLDEIVMDYQNSFCRMP